MKTKNKNWKIEVQKPRETRPGKPRKPGKTWKTKKNRTFLKPNSQPVQIIAKGVSVRKWHLKCQIGFTRSWWALLEMLGGTSQRVLYFYCFHDQLEHLQHYGSNFVPNCPFRTITYPLSSPVRPSWVVKPTHDPKSCPRPEFAQICI
jgi:hypothetical protein